MRFSTKKGFSFIEIMAVIAITLLILSISTLTFLKLNKKQSLEKALSNTIAVINSVRSLAVSSKEFCSYGVNISVASSSLTSFVVSDSSCTSENFHPTFLSLPNNFGVIISTSTISGGSIIFQKIGGNTANTGLLKLQLKNDSTSSSTITIYPTGLLETK
ncbi:MAG: type II secretion system protein [Minisyncoccia bacterium]